MIINKKKLEENINNRANSDIENKVIIGANVYVSQCGKVLLNESYGYKTVDKSEELKESDIFRMASMTKPIIAVAILKLIEEGKVDLFDAADKYIQGFNGFYIGKAENGKVVPIKKAENKIRILDLLTHSSGLGSGELWEIYRREIPVQNKESLGAIIEFYKRTCLSFEPYCGNEYSGQAAFDVLAKIIEVVSGKEIEEYLKKEIFIPLEMVDTTFVPSVEQWNRVVDMHDVVDGQNIAVNMKGCVFGDHPLTYKCGGAGLVSTIKDYAKFAEMLLGCGVYKRRRLLTEKTVKSMRTSHILEQFSWKDETWGLGVIVRKEGNVLPTGSFGWSGAYGTHFWVDPLNNIFAIYLRNSLNAGGSGAITKYNFEKDVVNSVF